MTNLFELIKKVNFKILRLIQLHQNVLRKAFLAIEKKEEKIIKNFICVFTFFINFLS